MSNSYKRLLILSIIKKASEILPANKLEDFIMTSSSAEDIIQSILSIEKFCENFLKSFDNQSHATAGNSLKRLLELKESSFRGYKDVVKKLTSDYSEGFEILESKFPDKILKIFKALINLGDALDKVELFEDKLNQLSHEHHYGGKTYIRFGKYHKSERSIMGLGEEWEQELGGKTHEDGVSVYETKPFKGKWLLIDSNPEKALYGYKGFDVNLFEQAIKNNQVYLVTGKEVNGRFGADGEVLLNDLAPIKKLSPDDIIFNSGTTLEEFLKRHRNFEGYKVPAGQKRDFINGFNFITDKYESDLLSPEDSEFFERVLNKINWSPDPEKLTKEEFDFFLQRIEQFKKDLNKKLVFKGYRPFY